MKKGKTVDDVGTASRGGRRNPTPAAEEEARRKDKDDGRPRGYLFGVPAPPDKAVFADAQRSFEWFRSKSSLGEAMEENRAVLKDRIAEAKLMGERANQSRSTITYLKNSIEAIRRERALQGLRSEGKEEEEGGGQEVSGYTRSYVFSSLRSFLFLTLLSSFHPSIHPSISRKR